MPIYEEPGDPNFRRLEERHGWFERVVEFEYGERSGGPGSGGDTASEEEDVPPALNWLLSLPETVRYDIDTVECSLAFLSADKKYACTLWDVSGEDDLPWAVFVVDDFGARLLPEYSVLDNDAPEEALEDALRRAADEIPGRLEGGGFTRAGKPMDVPDYLRMRRDSDEEEKWT